MADTWYVRTNSDGVVIRVIYDDLEAPQPGDIQLDRNWYFGSSVCGIQITDPVRGELYTVSEGRLVPRFPDSNELSAAKGKRKKETEEQWISPILGPKRKQNLPKARKEVDDHLDGCINVVEVKHTRLLGY